MFKSTKIIKTKSFEIAAYVKGAEDLERLALVLPGRLDTKDYPHMKSHVDLLAKKGYYALSFDPPGTWESSGGIDTYTIANYLKAINELIEYFGSKPTFVMGHSRGGSIAMLAGTRIEEIAFFAVVMSNYSASKIDERILKDGAEKSYRDLPDDSSKKKQFNLPLSYFEDAKKYNMLNDLKVCHKPKLFIAGLRDQIVKKEAVKEAFEVSAQPKYFETVDFGHDYRKNNQQIEQINELIEEFIDKSSE